MLFTHANLFTPVDLRRRVFRKVAKASLRDRLLVMTQSGDEEAANYLAKHVRYREAAFEATQVAQLVIDHNATVVLANERARTILGFNTADLNRVIYDLELSYRIPELRVRLEEVNIVRRPVGLKEIDWVTPLDEKRVLDIQLIPLFDNSTLYIGTMLIFSDITRYKHLQEEIEHSNQELETAYEELQSTNEELETTNEELQSTVEELETTNEELQSTNEELETMNEELQSSNEELQTMNEELRHRTDELNQVNGFLESILTSMRSAVVVMDRELQVQVWSAKAEDLWGVRESEVEGKNFLGLDIGLPIEQLKTTLRGALAGQGHGDSLILPATNRKGQQIQCRVTCNPLVNGSKHEILGVIVLMEEFKEEK
jgi:two-component system, chemotaxis family, CheB/CheR fusion protein